MTGVVSCHLVKDIARVRIANPARFNAMSRSMWLDLSQVFMSLNQQTSLQAVVIEGEGGHFCAGGDISEYPDFRFEQARLRSFHEDEVWGGLQAVLDCDIPVIAAIRGNCMGAGVEIASACDVRLATDGAKFGAPIARLGFPMAPREAQLVARAVGDLTAREMLLCASVLTASEMKERGFLNRVVPEDDLSHDVERLLKGMSQLSPLAARRNKQTLRALAAGAPMEALLARAYDYAAHPEHREGVSAFMEKRPPVFR
jgi:enoyl-CoA hydratase/carnithine racemase